MIFCMGSLLVFSEEKEKRINQTCTPLAILCEPRSAALVEHFVQPASTTRLATHHTEGLGKLSALLPATIRPILSLRTS